MGHPCQEGVGPQAASRYGSTGRAVAVLLVEQGLVRGRERLAQAQQQRGRRCTVQVLWNISVQRGGKGRHDK